MGKLRKIHTEKIDERYFETAIGILPDAVQQLGQVCSHNLANLLLYHSKVDFENLCEKFDFWWVERSYGSIILMAVDQQVCLFCMI